MQLTDAGRFHETRNVLEYMNAFPVVERKSDGVLEPFGDQRSSVVNCDQGFSHQPGIT